MGLRIALACGGVEYRFEHDGMPLMPPETRSGGTLLVAINVEAFLEELIGEDSGLRKSVNAATKFQSRPSPRGRGA